MQGSISGTAASAGAPPSAWARGKQDGWYDIPPANVQKTIVITGANSGIGFAAASKLAKVGHSVVLVCRTADKAFKACDQIRVRPFPIRLSKRAQLAQTCLRSGWSHTLLGLIGSKPPDMHGTGKLAFCTHAIRGNGHAYVHWAGMHNTATFLGLVHGKRHRHATNALHMLGYWHNAQLFRHYQMRKGFTELDIDPAFCKLWLAVQANTMSSVCMFIQAHRETPTSAGTAWDGMHMTKCMGQDAHNMTKLVLLWHVMNCPLTQIQVHAALLTACRNSMGTV